MSPLPPNHERPDAQTEITKARDRVRIFMSSLVFALG